MDTTSLLSQVWVYLSVYVRVCAFTRVCPCPCVYYSSPLVWRPCCRESLLVPRFPQQHRDVGAAGGDTDVPCLQELPGTGLQFTEPVQQLLHPMRFRG